MPRKELFYYVTSVSNVTRDVHWCVAVDYQQIANGKIANQIHGFTIDYGKFILISNIKQFYCVNIQVASSKHKESWENSRHTCNFQEFSQTPSV